MILAVFGPGTWARQRDQAVPSRRTMEWSRSTFVAVMGAHMWAISLHNGCQLRDAGGGDDKKKSEHIPLAILGAHVWAHWLHNPWRLGGPEVETIKICLITPTLLGLPETEMELVIST